MCFIYDCHRRLLPVWTDLFFIQLADILWHIHADIDFTRFTLSFSTWKFDSYTQALSNPSYQSYGWSLYCHIHSVHRNQSTFFTDVYGMVFTINNWFVHHRIPYQKTQEYIQAKFKYIEEGDFHISSSEQIWKQAIRHSFRFAPFKQHLLSLSRKTLGIYTRFTICIDSITCIDRFRIVV